MHRVLRSAMRKVFNLFVVFCASATLLSRADVSQPSVSRAPGRSGLSAPVADTEDERRAAALFQAGAVDEAITDLSGAIQRNLTNATAIFYRACAYRAKGAFEQSLTEWNRYIQLNPTNDFAYKSRASVYNATGRFDSALKDWDAGLRLSPQDATALAMRGFSYFKTGQYQKAADDFHAALQLEPTNHPALNNLAWLHATCPVAAFRDGQQAIQQATTACDITGWADWTRIDTLAAAFAEAGQFQKSIESEQRAMGMSAPGAADLKAMQERLLLYQQRKPFREVQQ